MRYLKYKAKGLVFGDEAPKLTASDDLVVDFTLFK